MHHAVCFPMQTTKPHFCCIVLRITTQSVFRNRKAVVAQVFGFPRSLALRRLLRVNSGALNAQLKATFIPSLTSPNPDHESLLSPVILGTFLFAAQLVPKLHGCSHNNHDPLISSPHYSPPRPDRDPQSNESCVVGGRETPDNQVSRLNSYCEQRRNRTVCVLVAFEN